jgi:hypothetical protein
LSALISYLWFGRAQTSRDAKQDVEHSFWQSVALGVTHCGAGCSLADMLMEAGMFVFSLSFVVLGQEVFGNWIVDYAFALAFDVIFQYAAKVEMSDDSKPKIWWQAFKTDFWSLASWQNAMYGWMAISIFVLFDEPTMKRDHRAFWLMMQVAMVAAFITTYPTNWVLISKGIAWFIAFSMCILAIEKLRDLDSFATMFLGYDLAAQRWVPRAHVYPFAEALAGILMISHALTWLSAPLALIIGGIGAVSVFYAVYGQKRELKCACVGGSSKRAAWICFAYRKPDDSGDGRPDVSFSSRRRAVKSDYRSGIFVCNEGVDTPSLLFELEGTIC